MQKYIRSHMGFIKEIREVTFLPNEIYVKWLTLVEMLFCYWAGVNPML